MAGNLDLKFKLSAVGGDKVNKAFKASNAEIKKLNKEVNSSGATGAKAFKKSTDGVKKLGNEVKRTNSFLTSSKGLLTGFFGVAAGAALVSSIFDVNREMESLRAQLKSLTGSSEGAGRAFSFIQDFAKDTPFQIQGLTKTFINLQNFGIKPTTEVMAAITNQASKLGASQDTLSGITLALGQAYAKGKLQAEEMLQLVERGVPVYSLLAEATGKNASELSKMASKGLLGRDVIDQLIVKMGELAKGSNADAINTLNGTISNLSDSWVRFQDTLLGDKSEGFIKTIIQSTTDGVNDAIRIMDGAGASVESQIKRQQDIIKSFEASGSFGQAVFDFLGADINLEKTRLDNLLKQKEARDKIAVSTEKESAQAISLAQSQEKIKGIEDERAAQLKANSDLADSAIENLQREIALRKDSSTEAAVQYDIAFGRLKDISALEKERLLTLAAQKDAIRGVTDESNKSGSTAEDDGTNVKKGGDGGFAKVRSPQEVLNEIAGKSFEQIQQETFDKQKKTDSNNALLQERLRFEGKTNDPRFNPDFKQDTRFSDTTSVQKPKFKTDEQQPKFKIDEQQAINAAKSVNTKVREYLEANPLKQTVEMVFTNTENGAALDSEALAGGTR